MTRLCDETEEIYAMADRAERDGHEVLAGRLLEMAPKAEWTGGKNSRVSRAEYLERARGLYREVYG